MSTKLQDTIEKVIVIKAPIERVYNAISTPEEIVKWFPDRLEGKIEPGETVKFFFGEHGETSLCITSADPHTYFSYRWVPGAAGNGGKDVLSQPHTLVEFRLKEVEEGTQLSLLESGFASLTPEAYEPAIQQNTGGWDFMIPRLASVVEKS